MNKIMMTPQDIQNAIHQFVQDGGQVTKQKPEIAPARPVQFHFRQPKITDLDQTGIEYVLDGIF